MNRHHQQEINRNSHRSFSNYSHPNNQIITDHVHEGQQLRNSLKRPRESVHQHQQDFMSTDDDPYPPPSHNTSNKRFKGMKNYYTSNNNNNNHGLLMSNIKSDDEVSLAEETPVQTTAPFPHHSSLLPYHQQKNNYDNQESSQNISSVVNVTDYQPMNSLLGNLHTIKRRRQVDVQQLQPRYYSHMKPSNNNHNQQQHNHHRHGDHSIPVMLNGASSLPENRRSPKKVVSLRVNSNLY
mmetsp:Transcript_50201/g.56852  ORF Transcript_50201/g.56852 Transcript_50201/m.56852 type:complete len:238 (-) Transcript_50201:176-889(-)